jgi:hypothetical protein
MNQQTIGCESFGDKDEKVEKFLGRENEIFVKKGRKENVEGCAVTE